MPDRERIRADFAPAAGGGTGPSDRLLVQRALRGESDAVDQVLARLAPVVRFVYRLNRQLGCGLSPDRLEDVVQQVYMTVWTRLRDYAGASALESWAFGFCRNCLRAETRRGRSLRVQPMQWNDASADSGEARSMHEPADPNPRPDQTAALLEDAGVVREELARLAGAEREAVVLRHLEGWSFEAIARQQGVPASTIKDRCYRGLHRIKERLRARNVHE